MSQLTPDNERRAREIVRPLLADRRAIPVRLTPKSIYLLTLALEWIKDQPDAPASLQRFRVQLEDVLCDALELHYPEAVTLLTDGTALLFDPLSDE